MARRIRPHIASLSSLHGPPISVQSKKDRVTLTDTVASWQKHQPPAREAYERGAHDVNNHLQVCPLAQPQAALAPTS